MMLADSHYHDYAGADAWPILLAVVVLGVIAVLVAVLLARRRPQPQGNLPPEGDLPMATPAGDYCEETILEILRQKGRPMDQKDICADTGLSEEEVAGALAGLEQQGRIKRTWDRGNSTYMVEAT